MLCFTRLWDAQFPRGFFFGSGKGTNQKKKKKKVTDKCRFEEELS